jgi:hypothetical protein
MRRLPNIPFGALGQMNEEDREIPAFACCSVGIGRWFWVAWANESDARGLAQPLASGYEKSAERAEETVVARLGSEVKRLPAKWASGYKRDGVAKAGTGSGKREDRIKSRFDRLAAKPKRAPEAQRLAFLFSVIAREPPDSHGHVTVTRHRIVKQTTGKTHVDREPFDENEWASRSERNAGSPEIVPRPHTVAVDRHTLRKEGRYHVGRADLTFYGSEEAGIRDVEEALTAKYAWCAVLGVRFPCSVDDIKAAYRRLALSSHPDRGGGPAEFQSAEQAYRAALAYFSKSTTK